MINLSHFVVGDKILFRGQNQQNNMNTYLKIMLFWVTFEFYFHKFSPKNQQQEKKKEKKKKKNSYPCVHTLLKGEECYPLL